MPDDQQTAGRLAGRIGRLFRPAHAPENEETAPVETAQAARTTPERTTADAPRDAVAESVQAVEPTTWSPFDWWQYDDWRLEREGNPAPDETQVEGLPEGWVWRDRRDVGMRQLVGPDGKTVEHTWDHDVDPEELDWSEPTEKDVIERVRRKLAADPYYGADAGTGLDFRQAADREVMDGLIAMGRAPIDRLSAPIGPRFDAAATTRLVIDTAQAEGLPHGWVWHESDPATGAHLISLVGPDRRTVAFQASVETGEWADRPIIDAGARIEDVFGAAARTEARNVAERLGLNPGYGGVAPQRMTAAEMQETLDTPRVDVGMAGMRDEAIAEINAKGFVVEVSPGVPAGLFGTMSRPGVTLWGDDVNVTPGTVKLDWSRSPRTQLVDLLTAVRNVRSLPDVSTLTPADADEWRKRAGQAVESFNRLTVRDDHRMVERRGVANGLVNHRERAMTRDGRAADAGVEAIDRALQWMPPAERALDARATPGWPNPTTAQAVRQRQQDILER